MAGKNKADTSRLKIDNGIKDNSSNLSQTPKINNQQSTGSSIKIVDPMAVRNADTSSLRILKSTDSGITVAPKTLSGTEQTKSKRNETVRLKVVRDTKKPKVPTHLGRQLSALSHNSPTASNPIAEAVNKAATSTIKLDPRPIDKLTNTNTKSGQHTISRVGSVGTKTGRIAIKLAAQERLRMPKKNVANTVNKSATSTIKVGSSDQTPAPKSKIANKINKSATSTIKVTNAPSSKMVMPKSDVAAKVNKSATSTIKVTNTPSPKMVMPKGNIANTVNKSATSTIKVTNTPAIKITSIAGKIDKTATSTVKVSNTQQPTATLAKDISMTATATLQVVRPEKPKGPKSETVRLKPPTATTSAKTVKVKATPAASKTVVVQPTPSQENGDAKKLNSGISLKPKSIAAKKATPQPATKKEAANNTPAPTTPTLDKSKKSSAPTLGKASRPIINDNPSGIAVAFSILSTIATVAAIVGCVFGLIKNINLF